MAQVIWRFLLGVVVLLCGSGLPQAMHRAVEHPPSERTCNGHCRCASVRSVHGSGSSESSGSSTAPGERGSDRPESPGHDDCTTCQMLGSTTAMASAAPVVRFAGQPNVEIFFGAAGIPAAFHFLRGHGSRAPPFSIG
jgi:hypothetical protein